MSHLASAAVVGQLAIVAALPSRAENVTFITDFAFNGRHAYYYVALERGFHDKVTPRGRKRNHIFEPRNRLHVRRRRRAWRLGHRCRDGAREAWGGGARRLNARGIRTRRRGERGPL